MMTGVIVKVEARIILELTEGEAAALDAIAGYGAEAFLKVFKEHLGKHYIEPYEKHIDSLFQKGHGLLNVVRHVQKIRDENKFIKAD